MDIGVNQVANAKNGSLAGKLPLFVHKEALDLCLFNNRINKKNYIKK